MSGAVTYLGRTYGDDTNWLAVIREAARYSLGPSWLRSDIDVASALAELAEQLKGTPAERALGEAALSLIESGTAPERAVVWQLPWERGANAIQRLLRLVQTDRDRLAEVRGVPNVLWRLLQIDPSHSALWVPEILATVFRKFWPLPEALPQLNRRVKPEVQRAHRGAVQLQQPASLEHPIDDGRGEVVVVEDRPQTRAVCST